MQSFFAHCPVTRIPFISSGSLAIAGFFGLYEKIGELVCIGTVLALYKGESTGGTGNLGKLSTLAQCRFMGDDACPNKGGNGI